MACDVYMGAEDVERQRLNVFRMEMMGATVHAVETGTRTLKDAVDAAFGAWMNDLEAFYVLGSAVAVSYTHLFQMKQVKRAVHEQNGQLIVVQMGDENPKYPVVTDGVIQVDVLESIGRNEEWLLDNLSKQGHDNVANIFIAEYDKGVVSVVTYE